MHRALHIEEILLNIFGHCRLPGWHSADSDLPRLARTCRVFKEPALDVLWAELFDPTPLARCLPEATRNYGSSQGVELYSFSRSLTQIEWAVLRSYTRRILSMHDCSRTALDWDSVGIYLSPPITEPLFPNLRSLYVGGPTNIAYLLCMPFPSLLSFGVKFRERGKLDVLQCSLESLRMFSPDLTALSIDLNQSDTTFNKFLSTCIRGWRDIRIVECKTVAFDVSAFTHLSRMPALTRLSCLLSAILPLSASPIVFSSLQDLTLFSDSLDTVSQFLARTQLSMVTKFTTYIDGRPSRQDVFCFFVTLQKSVVCYTIQQLRVIQRLTMKALDGSAVLLGFEDLEPCMAFKNLRHIEVNISWKVDLADEELLRLASAWPHLEDILINAGWGWSTRGSGITPDGLLQLLQKCRSLSQITLAMDTRGYTKFRSSPASLELTLPHTSSIDVLNSFIEAESVLAIADFFAAIAPGPNFAFRACRSWLLEDTEYKNRWDNVYRQANDVIRERSRHTFGISTLDSEALINSLRKVEVCHPLRLLELGRD